jgi:hypothetical protein
MMLCQRNFLHPVTDNFYTLFSEYILSPNPVSTVALKRMIDGLMGRGIPDQHLFGDNELGQKPTTGQGQEAGNTHGNY